MWPQVLLPPDVAGRELSMLSLRRYVFYWGGGGGGGGARASDERVLSKFFTNWGGSVLFYSQPGEGHSLFCKDKITPCRLYFVYTSKATCQD